MFEVKYGTSAVQWYSYKQMKRGLCTVQYGTVLVPYSLVNVHNSTEPKEHTYGTLPTVFRAARRSTNKNGVQYEYETMIHRMLANVNELEERTKNKEQRTKSKEQRTKNKERLANSGRVCMLVRLNFFRLFQNRESDPQPVATPTPVQL